MERSKGVVVRNPYARKKKPPTAAAVPAQPPTHSAIPNDRTSSNSSSRRNNGNENSTSPPQWNPRVVATTFSQAFGGHEDENDDDTYGGATSSNTATSASSRPLGRSPSKASAHATALQQTIEDEAAHPDLTDRDSHVLLSSQPHVLYVSHKQKGNAVLQYIRNVPMAYSRMVPDFILHAQRCALFLSCKYHALYPAYIHRRIAELGRDFELRILLVLVDVQDNAATLRQLNKLAVINELTLILAWSEEEAARYLETFKAFDGKDATLIQKREQTHFADQVADFLTACKTVNKTDSAMLLQQFGSLARLAQAGADDLALVAGMGQVKVKRLHEAWHKPFSKKAAAKRKKLKQEAAEASNTGDKDTESTAKANTDSSTAGNKEDI